MVGTEMADEDYGADNITSKAEALFLLQRLREFICGCDDIGFPAQVGIDLAIDFVVVDPDNVPPDEQLRRALRHTRWIEQYHHLWPVRAASADDAEGGGSNLGELFDLFQMADADA